MAQPRLFNDEIDHGGIAGFDANGKLKSAAWIMPDIGMTEKMARSDCRKGGLAVKKVTTPELRALMVEHGWVKA